MGKIEFLKGISALFFLSILFLPSNSKAWIYFLALGILFGILWFRKI